MSQPCEVTQIDPRVLDPITPVNNFFFPDFDCFQFSSLVALCNSEP